MDKLENDMEMISIPQPEDLCFDLLYDRYISMTDTQALIENISTESLEEFLLQTAKYFYKGGVLVEIASTSD